MPSLLRRYRDGPHHRQRRHYLGIDPVRGVVYATVLPGCLAPFLIVIIPMIAQWQRDGRVPQRLVRHHLGFLAAAVIVVAAITLGAVSLVG